MTQKHDADSEAVDRFKSGEDSAFEELMSRYEGRIYGFLSRTCNDSEKAKDVVQETFLTAFRYLKGFRGEASFKTWLYKIASTACFRSRRRRKNEPKYHLSLDDFVPGEVELKELAKGGWHSTPVEELLNGELREHINASLMKLSENYRIVFILRDIEGFSAEEVSKMHNISIPAVKSRLHRARLFLRKELAEYYKG